MRHDLVATIGPGGRHDLGAGHDHELGERGDSEDDESERADHGRDVALAGFGDAAGPGRELRRQPLQAFVEDLRQSEGGRLKDQGSEGRGHKHDRRNPQQHGAIASGRGRAASSISVSARSMRVASTPS